MAIDTLGANALASNSVTTAKIANDAVTGAKIPADAVVAADIADGSVTTAKLAADAVTSAKIADDGVTSAKLDTNIAVAGTLGVTGATTLSSTLASGAITSTGAVQGTQFNVGGLKVLETSTFDYGNSTNKSVNTAYDFTYTLAAGTWIPFLKFYAAFFENHGNSNSTGVYYPFTYLGSQAGGEEYGSHYTILPKWGNASNSYSSMSHSALAPFTLSSSSTIYIRWYAIEYGTSSNYWCRNSGNKIIFLRIG